MFEGHSRALGLAIQLYSTEPNSLGLILIGSVAKEVARRDSDLDFLWIVDEMKAGRKRAFIERRPELDKVHYFDVKVMDLPELRRAVPYADDPMRACLESARVVWVKSGPTGKEIAGLIEAICAPPPSYFADLQATFIAEAALYGLFFVAEGQKHDNRLLLHHAASHFATAVGRAVLARNSMIFHSAKNMGAQLARCTITLPDLPARLADFLDRPRTLKAIALYGELIALGDWPITEEAMLDRFVSDKEFAWVKRRTR